MPLLGFKKQFAPLIESGAKRQTIRAKRKDGKNPHIGERLHLYTGLRTKSCRKLGEATCINVQEIAIFAAGIVLSGVWLSTNDQECLARADGFDDFGKMSDFFEKEHGLPFWGLLIEW